MSSTILTAVYRLAIGYVLGRARRQCLREQASEVQAAGVDYSFVEIASRLRGAV